MLSEYFKCFLCNTNQQKFTSSGLMSLAPVLHSRRDCSNAKHSSQLMNFPLKSIAKATLKMFTQMSFKFFSNFMRKEGNSSFQNNILPWDINEILNPFRNHIVPYKFGHFPHMSLAETEWKSHKPRLLR